MDEKFKVYAELDCERLEKSFVLQGIASTATKDADGEYLDPNGFDLSYFKEKGQANWQHRSKEPEAVVGFPASAKVFKKGEKLPDGNIADKDLLWTSIELYDNIPMADDIVKLARAMKNSNSGRSLSFSIEGEVLERDPSNPKIVNRAKLTGIAITPTPKNTDSVAELIEKGFEMTPDSDMDCLIDVTDPETGERVIVDMNYEIKVIKPSEVEEKAVTTTTVQPLAKEDLSKKVVNIYNVKKSIEMTDEVKDALAKAKEKLGIEQVEKACAPKEKEMFEKTDDEDKDDTEVDSESETMPENGKEPKNKTMSLKKSYTPEDLGCANESEMEETILKAQEIAKLVKTVINGETVYVEKEPEVLTKAITDNFEKATLLKEQNIAVLKAVESVGTSFGEISKALSDQLNKLMEVNKGLSERLEAVENTPLRKSFTGAKPVERFAKSEDGKIQLGTSTNKDAIIKALTTLSVDSNTKVVKDQKLANEMGLFNLGVPLTQYGLDALKLNGIDVVIE